MICTPFTSGCTAYPPFFESRIRLREFALHWGTSS
jgi:hypothetical protein